MNRFTQELNAVGLNCPLPILRTKKAIQALSAGEILKVIATDPGASKDMQAFCKQTGHVLLAAEQQAERYEFFIQKA